MAKFTFDALDQGNASVAGVTIYDGEHTPLKLGAEQQLGRTGASGSVYELPGRSDFCVKIYRPEDLADKGKRAQIVSCLRAMINMPGCARNRSLAWPLGTVHDKSGSAIGYAMRRIPKGATTFKSLFGGAAAVSRYFPKWGRRELAITAMNFVDMLRYLEGYGVRPGDFNPENFLVDENCNVMFIDCDSFSFRDRNGNVHTNGMFFPDCAAPEILRGPNIADQPRTLQQTCFSAAVLSFMLIMTGQHPYTFAGEALDGTTTGSPAENVLAGKCPLGHGAGCKQDPRWYALWSWLPASLQCAFIATFRDGHSNPAMRTTLLDLSAELGKFKHVCEIVPERNALSPAAPKPRGSAMRTPAGVPPSCGAYPQVATGCPGNQMPSRQYAPRPRTPYDGQPYPYYSRPNFPRQHGGYGRGYNSQVNNGFNRSYRPFGLGH